MFLAPLLWLAGQASPSPIEAQLQAIEARSQGKLGAAVVTAQGAHYRHPDDKFSLQSVMKLMVAMAALEQVDRGQWRLDQSFEFKRSDLSLSHQPITERLGRRESIMVTLDECIELMVTESCSGAADFIIRRLGGPQRVNDFLVRHDIQGMRIDRQERDLQTQIGGITWRPEYIDEDLIEAAYAAVPPAEQDAAFARYLADPRDTTTPAAMANLLQKLLKGQLFSPTSTRYLLAVMERTATGPDRLQAGVPKGWTLGHKTGTSSTHRGVAGATNDVGIARNKAGDWVILVALLRESTLAPRDRDRILADVARTGFPARR
jgi:beta-lactamase class A